MARVLTGKKEFQRALTREREDAIFKLLGATVSNPPPRRQASECLLGLGL